MNNLKIKNADGDIKYVQGVGAGTSNDPFKSVNYCVPLDENKKPYYKLLDTEGNGTGNNDMAVNGSETPVTFIVKPDIGEIIKISSLTLLLLDVKGFSSTRWGSRVELDNGVYIKWLREGVLYDIIGPLKSHYDLATYAHSSINSAFTNGEEFLINHFKFTELGQFITLDGDAGDTLQVIINDDLTALKNQRAIAQGYYE